MATRTITANGRNWRVMPTGRVTQNDRDEFSLMFISGEGTDRIVRLTRYSPQGTRSREQSFAELSEADLIRLLHNSQPSATSPEADYAR
ncbi:MAG: hypothetical protein ACJ796_23020 [Gemmatimonadaceae bacterium]